MLKRMLWLAMVAVMVVVLAGPVWAQDDLTPQEQAVAFLLTMQNEDGGFTNGFAPESDIGTTADVVVASVLAGQDPEGFFTGDMMNPLVYLGGQVAEGNFVGAGQLAKVILAVEAVGKDADDFAGHDLIADLLVMQDEAGVLGFGAFDHCLGMIALQNAAVKLPEGALDALLAVQDESGGWGFMAGEAPDTNTTALCLQALALTDSVGAIDAGLAYLAAIQNEDGGWPYQNPSEYGTDSDVNSTALVLQALIAAGEDPVDWNNPQDWLASMQLESGAFSFQEAMPGDNVPATVAAIPALAGYPLNAFAPEPEMAEAE